MIRGKYYLLLFVIYIITYLILISKNFFLFCYFKHIITKNIVKAERSEFILAFTIFEGYNTIFNKKKIIIYILPSNIIDNSDNIGPQFLYA